MILCIQIILIIVSIFVLVTLYIDEKRNQKAKIPTARLTELWDGGERRRFIRINSDVPVKYSPPKESHKQKLTKTKNISAGGICMTLNEKLSPHSNLSLEINFPGSPKPITAKGEVMWVAEDTKQKNEQGIRYFNAGIEFKDISPQDRERLFNFIKESRQS